MLGSTYWGITVRVFERTLESSLRMSTTPPASFKRTRTIARNQTEVPAKRHKNAPEALEHSAAENTTETPASKRLKENFSASTDPAVADTPTVEPKASKPRHVYAVIYETLARNCIPYYPEEHKEEVIELYEELGDANNRVRREWEEYGDALGWDVEVSFDGGREMWRVEDYEGLSTGVHVYIKEWEVRGPGSEPAPERTRPLPGEETYK